jgi:hypothetical protein
MRLTGMTDGHIIACGLTDGQSTGGQPQMEVPMQNAAGRPRPGSSRSS